MQRCEQIFRQIYKWLVTPEREASLFGKQKVEHLLFAPNLLANLGDNQCQYWEFPLKGSPWLDITILLKSGDAVGHCRSGELLPPDFPYRPAFCWAMENLANDCSFGLDFDFSSKATTIVPGFYIDNADNDNLVAGVLTALGEERRLSRLQSFLSALPDGWERYYLGLKRGRPGLPIRLGLRINQQASDHYFADPGLFLSHLRQLGFKYGSEALAKEMLFPAFKAKGFDLQLDIFEDGSLGPDISSDYYFALENKTKPLHLEANRRLMEECEKAGLIDDRWKLLDGCFTAKHLPYLKGGKLHTALVYCDNNNLKRKWRKGSLLETKLYFTVTMNFPDETEK